MPRFPPPTTGAAAGCGYRLLWHKQTLTQLFSVQIQKLHVFISGVMQWQMQADIPYATRTMSSL